MKSLFPVFLILLSVPLTAALSPGGETYRWVNDAGIVQFSDNPASVPARYRSRVTVGDDITLENPEVRESVEESRKLAAELERQDRVANRRRTQERLAREAREERERREELSRTAAASRQKTVIVTKRVYKTRPT